MPNALNVMSTKPNKENIVTDILVELEKGVERGKALAKIVKKWQISARTFDRHWKTANERHLFKQQDKQIVLAEVSLESDKERFKTAILSKEQSLEILSQIALSDLKKDSDRINAVKTMADIEGWKSPLKTENNISINNNVDVSQLSDEVLAELEKAYNDLEENEQ